MFGLSGAWINEFLRRFRRRARRGFCRNSRCSWNRPDRVRVWRSTPVQGCATADAVSVRRIAQEGPAGMGRWCFGRGLPRDRASERACRWHCAGSLPTEQLIQFVSYEGTLTALNGPAAGSGSADAGVAEGGSTPPGASIQLTGAGITGARSRGTPRRPTPRMLNPWQSFVPCGAGTVVTFADLEGPGNSDAGILKTSTALGQLRTFAETPDRAPR